MNVLISGSTTGIGLATAVAFAEKGHRVFAGMRDANQAEPLAEVAAVDSILARSSEIDVLVNNAGVERMGSVEESPLEDFRACMQVNYFGTLRCIQAVLPASKPHLRALRLAMREAREWPTS